MKLKYQLAIALLGLLVWNGCKVDIEQPLTNEQLTKTDVVVTGCDDTTAFKSSVDLQPLEYLRNCYSCTAIKQVPGLGEIPWTGNCEVYIADSTLQLRFMTYKPYFEELLLREYLAFDYVPISIGIRPILDYDQWQQNQSLSFGSYARLLDDGDVSDGFWGTDTTCMSYIEITRVDLEDMEVEGRFEIHLRMKEQGTHGILYSERINFLNGRFKAGIEDW